VGRLSSDFVDATQHGESQNVNLPGVLSAEQIRDKIMGQPALVSGYLDLEAQLQPNGFDLTLADVSKYVGPGTIAQHNADRVLPELTALDPDLDGFYALSLGAYHIAYNETVQFPNDLMALGRPRSSLNRSGVTINSAVWDCGYHGRSTSMLVVANSYGFRIERGARLFQLVFFGLSRATITGYSGTYQGENIR
jgi:dUTP pyrophosphatase